MEYINEYMLTMMLLFAPAWPFIIHFRIKHGRLL